MPSQFSAPLSPFPQRADHEAQWKALARDIAQSRSQISDAQPDKLPQNPGSLTILGSGIEAVSFTTSDEVLLRNADHVLYCVADPATIVWLKHLRPDALDLYVLYDDTKVRYTTYVQMTEAMLYHVRGGKSVVAVFYGHPGVFVLSTHRAIAIARREGHRAVMRPAVSALDSLCADLGVDPSQPGLQTMEATEMLVRTRVPDRSLHVVLWQVGLIGELGFRREGCLNSRFIILLDYLQDIYGPEQEVVNYIASRYPGVDPLIERHTIASLRDPAKQKNVTGISTFYIPPVDVIPSNVDMLFKLGLLKPGQCVTTPSTPIRKIDQYGPREQKAFDDFASFRVSANYHWQPDTPAARFILDLREDAELQQRYCTSPIIAVAQWAGKLTNHDRKRLIQRDSGAMQIAAKGLHTIVPPPVNRFFRSVLTKEPNARAMLRAARAGQEAFRDWAVGAGHATLDWRAIPEHLRNLLRAELFPWTGVYLAADRRLAMVLHALPGNVGTNRLYLNGRRVTALRFSQGMLIWQDGDGNDTSGSLRVDLSPRGARRLVGCVWPAGEELGSSHRVVALEHVMPTGVPVASFSGLYSVSGRDIRVMPCWDAGERCATVAAFENGDMLPDFPVVQNGGMAVGELFIPFAKASELDKVPEFMCGEYTLRLFRGDNVRLARVRIGTQTLSWEETEVELEAKGGRQWSWSGGKSLLEVGEISAVMDPISLHGMLFGEVGTGVAKWHLRGMQNMSPESLAARKQRVDFGMPRWAWEGVVDVCREACDKGGLFLWHGWNRSVVNLRRLRRVLTIVEPWEQGEE